MLWLPIALGGTYAAGTSALSQFIWYRKISLEKILLSASFGAGVVIADYYITKAWQNWLKKQFLYKLHQFSQTRLYSDLLWIRTNYKYVGIYSSAAVAGGILGAAFGIGISQTVWGQSGREKAIDFYGGNVSFDQWAEAISGLQNKMAAQLTFFLQSLNEQVRLSNYHEPSEFSYTFGMDKTQQNPSPSQDFPLGLGPGGTVY